MEQTKDNLSLTFIHDDVLIYIFGFLHFKEFANITRVNSHWYKLANVDSLLLDLCRNFLSFPQNERVPPKQYKTFKEFFKTLVQRLKWI